MFRQEGTSRATKMSGSRNSAIRVLGLFSTTAAIVALATTSSASAQTKIEQMVVTAQKRAQDIQTVPASISAFSGDALEARQVKSIEDLSGATPNVTWQIVNGVPQLSIRGISPDGFSSAVDPTIALHIDGVYQPRVGSMMSLVMTDLDSVEVLRGPQGTLYGRNANGGVINLNTKKPTDMFEASATIFGGSYKRYGARGYVSGPIANGVSLRLNALVDRSEGFGKNLTTGNDIDGKWAYGGRIAVRLQPTDDVTIDLSAARSYEHNSNGYYAFSPPRGQNYVNILASGNSGQYTLAPHKLYSTFDPEWRVIADYGTAVAAWDISSTLSVKSITSWQRFQSLSNVDIDQMSLDYLISKQPAQSHTFSQEFNLNAKLFDRLDAVVGLYYIRDSFFGGSDVYIPGGNPFGSVATRNVHLYNMLGEQTSTSKAVFADFNFSVTDDLRLLAGVRRTLDHRRTVQDSYTQLNGNLGPIIAGCHNVVQPDLDYHSTTGKLGVQYDITPDVMAYVSWQNGFKTGGYNPAVCGDTYDPENVYSWEGGVKSTLLDGSLTFNVSVFHYKYANMQLNRVTFASAVIDNAASAKLKGAEIEAVAYVTDDLKAELGIGLLDSKYGPLQARNSAEIGNPLVDLTGGRLPRAPKMTATGALEYTTRIGDFGELTSRGEVSYSSKVHYTAFAEAIATQKSYAVVNAIFTFAPDDCDLSFRAYARNLFDKDYANGITTSGILLYARGSWAPPRTFGAEVTAKF